MRRAPALATLAALVWLGLAACSGGAPTDPEALGRRVLALLEADDFDGFSELALTQADYEAIMARATFKDEERRAKMAERGARTVVKAAANARKGWDKVRTQAAKAGIVWSETSFVRVEPEIGLKDGIEAGDIFVVIAFHGAEYKIKLDDCLKADRGWVLVDNMRLRSPSSSDTEIEVRTEASTPPATTDPAAPAPAAPASGGVAP